MFYIMFREFPFIGKTEKELAQYYNKINYFRNVVSGILNKHINLRSCNYSEDCLDLVLSKIIIFNLN
jgi:hypothetical protein